MTRLLRFERFERAVYRLALLLALLAAARFGWVFIRQSWHNATAEKPHVTMAETTKLPTLADLQRQMLPPMAGPASLDSAIAEAVGSSKPAALPRTFVKSYLSVQAGKARSELRVDGLLVGRTPYVGQIGCERGKTVNIDLLPAKGMPKHYEVPCLEGEMHLRDEP
jgi:hypothetical protein